MIKSLVLHDIPLDAIAPMERWYYRDHAPEIVRRYGPWLARHESYLPVAAPPDALAYGMYDWRLTEGWWREVPEAGAQGALSFTPPPVVPTVATCFVPAQPTEDFVGSERVPADGAYLRWVVFLRYPERVAEYDGERWFRGTFAAEVAACPHVKRAFSYQTVREHIGLPGTWAPGAAPPMETLHLGWHRVVELWFESFAAWRTAVLGEAGRARPGAFAAPHWATATTFPFVQPYVDFAATFVLERPTDEFLRDVRAYMP